MTAPGETPPDSDLDQPAETVLDRMTDAFFAVDRDWQFTYLNDRGRDIVAAAMDDEIPRDDLVGRSLWEVVPDAAATIFEERYREAMRDQTAVSFEAYFTPLEEWLSVRVFPDETGLSVYFQQVTEDRRRRERVGVQKEVLREVYEVMADTDRPLASKIDEVLSIGRRVLDTGYGTVSRVEGDTYIFEAVQSPDGAIQAGDTVDLEATNCERTVLTEQTLVLSDIATEAPELTAKAGYQEWGISSYVGTPVVVGDDVQGTFCFYDTEPREEPFSEWQVTLVDVLGKWVSYELERRQVEQRLTRQNERLQDFASMVSHDLRNPLAIAMSTTEHIEATGDLERLDAVLGALDRMDEIITDILAMARDEDAVETLSDVHLSSVATAAWDTVETEGATLETPDDVTVMADEPRLQRLLENLFRNAVEHGGLDVTVTVTRTGDGFAVADDGPGIPEDERETVTTYGYTTSDTGTGLGLRIVEQIADAHGWSVTVTESSSGGARFEFSGR